MPQTSAGGPIVPGRAQDLLGRHVGVGADRLLELGGCAPRSSRG